MSTALKSTSKNKRKALDTRVRILQAAFQEIYRNGFQGMRLDDVLESTGLTKGALYYHFSNKLALGYAVVDELIEKMMVELWILPLQEASDPLDTLIERVEHLDELVSPGIVELGCPLNNLAQEMSPLDEGFRKRIECVFQSWHSGLVEALKRARNNGTLLAGVNIKQTATIVIAALEGSIGLTKNAQSLERLTDGTAALAGYLKSLRIATA